MVCFAWRSAAAATTKAGSHVVLSHKATQISYIDILDARFGDDWIVVGISCMCKHVVVAVGRLLPWPVGMDLDGANRNGEGGVSS